MLQPDKKTAVVNGHRMAYRELGEGDPIVFAHGNPTSSYLCRNVIPHLGGLGRLIVCDMIGMGDSDTLSPSGPTGTATSNTATTCSRCGNSSAWGRNVVLVLHDWGSALGFDWAAQHPDRVAGIAYGGAIVAPMKWDDSPDAAADLPSFAIAAAGEQMVLERNAFVDGVLPAGMLGTLSETDMAAYRAPLSTLRESRRPTLSGRGTYRLTANLNTWSTSCSTTAHGWPIRRRQSCSSTPNRRHHYRQVARTLPNLGQPDRNHGPRSPFHPRRQR